MNSYQIILKRSSKYQAVIYAVSYNNPIQDIHEISEYIRKQTNIAGYVLFDLLLSNGENFNRFAEGYFDGYEIKYSSIKVIELDDAKILQDVNSYYKKNRQVLNNGILSPSEKFKYAKN